MSMRSALFNGFVGIILTFWIGMGVLHLEPIDLVRAIVASEISGFVALLSILRGERTPWVRKHLFTRQAKTWLFFLSLYFGGTFALSPQVRPWVDLRAFLYLVLPLIMCTGFAIIIFGPIQDRWVARAQRDALK